MNRLTLAIMRQSRLGAAIGECASNLSVLREIVNAAQERLIHDPKAPEDGWWGGYAQMVFDVTVTNRQGYITAPMEVARLTDINVCNHPTPIRNRFYEFLAFGTGLRSTLPCCTASRCRPLAAYERDTVATLTQLAGNRRIDVYAGDAADIGQTVVIQGEDTNGKRIRSTDTVTMRAIEGEQVQLTDPFVSTVNTFSKVDGVLKGPTIGELTLEQYDLDNATSSALSSMQPGETTACYRRYFLDGLPSSCYTSSLATGIVQVTAIVKLDLVPAMSDMDYLLIQSKEALIEECMAIYFGSMDSPNASTKEAEHHTKALRLLRGQLDHYMGKTRVSVNVPIFGSNPIRPQPR